MLQQLNERSQEILREVVEAYVETGEPVGSRTVSRRLDLALSPATVRNVMADLEDAGLLYAPHTSSGRLPTNTGLRLFVDGLLELGNLTTQERRSIELNCQQAGRSVEELLGEATEVLSGLSHCACLVSAPKSEVPFRHIEFVSLSPGRAMAIVVSENGMVENRLIDVPSDLPPSALREAAGYLNARLSGHTLSEARETVQREIDRDSAQLDELTSRVVEAGFAAWAGVDKSTLIVRGQANLLDDVSALGDLEHIRSLFEALEAKKELSRLLEKAEEADGVQIFIGAETALFGLSECALIVAPYRNGDAKFVGAIGVIGPTRLNYARIIPMVDYTAQVIGKILG